jgi:hypothetical protein
MRKSAVFRMLRAEGSLLCRDQIAPASAGRDAGLLAAVESPTVRALHPPLLSPSG